MLLDAPTLAFALAAALLTITPGQDTMLVVRNVLRGGRADGVITTFGICAGLFVHATLSALGVSVVLMHSATAFQTLKAAGAAYLVWLGLRSLAGALRAAGEAANPDTEQALRAAAGVPARRCFVEGLLSNVLNPKTALFYLAFLPQFVAATDPVFERSLVLAGIHYVESVGWLVLVAIAVDRTRRLFLRSALRRWLDGICGLVLVGLGVRLALERRT